MAAGVGFEPTDELPRQRFSRPPDSTALAPRRALSLCRIAGLSAGVRCVYVPSAENCVEVPMTKTDGSATVSNPICS